jgi:hypothetical protein
MKYFAGLDVSLDETAICVVDEDGIVVTEAASEPDDLVRWLVATGLTITRVGLEAGPLSLWLHTELRAAGLPAICIETRRMKGVAVKRPTATIDRAVGRKPFLGELSASQPSYTVAPAFAPCESPKRRDHDGPSALRAAHGPALRQPRPGGRLAIPRTAGIGASRPFANHRREGTNFPIT